MTWFRNLWNWLKGIDASKIADEVVKVQALTARTCAFVPTAASVAAMLTAGNPAVVGVGAVAMAICKAISSKAAVKGVIQPRPMVNGVEIKGEFIAGGDAL